MVLNPLNARFNGIIILLLSISLPFVASQSTTTTTSTLDGSLANGPTTTSEEGTCQRSIERADVFECGDSTVCRWQSSSLNFICTTTTTTSTDGNEEVTNANESEGPPGRGGTCISHSDHWDCPDGSLCEIVEGVWVCEGGSSSSSESEGGENGTCVVHGGHTHGDCSGSCNGVDLGEYDLDLHIVALFVVLIGSTLGVMLPIVCSSVLSGKSFRYVFFVTKHFGTGVIICTAFIHLLYHAFIMFGNTCLGTLAFEPAAAAISLAGVYFVFMVDFGVMRWLRSRGQREQGTGTTEGGGGGLNEMGRDGSSQGSIGEKEHSPPPPPTPNLGHSHGGVELGGGINEKEHYGTKQAHFDVLILEAGIIFHSIMIGVSLGASGGDQWLPLFIAVVFHQLFEGLALGSRIGQLVWNEKKGQWKKWIMAGTFGLITPIGIAIGMGVHSSYNPNSGSSLLSIGILDSISAGILIYGGIVECLYHDFMQGELSRAKLSKVMLALFFVLMGSLCMAVLGKWA